MLLVKIDVGSGSILDSTNNYNRSISQFVDLTSSTVFTSGNGLTAIPLMTSLQMVPIADVNGVFSVGTDMQFGISA